VNRVTGPCGGVGEKWGGAVNITIDTMPAASDATIVRRILWCMKAGAVG